MSDISTIDLLKDHFGLETDTELAQYLNWPQSSISNIRAGRGDISPLMRATLMDKVGFVKGMLLVERISTKNLAEKIRSFTQANARRILKQNAKNYHDLELLNFLNSDDEMSKCMEINKKSVKDIESGKQKLELVNRLKIVEILYSRNNKLWPFSINDITSYTSSTENLLKELNRLSETVFLEQFKELIKIESDTKLADFLGVSKQLVSSIKNNPKKLGVESRVKILAELERLKESEHPFNPDQLEELFTNKEKLVNKILESETNQEK